MASSTGNLMAHILAGQPLAATIRYGTQAYIITPFSMDLNGNSITLKKYSVSLLSLLRSPEHHDCPDQSVDPRGDPAG